jgi:hypothetical protein
MPKETISENSSALQSSLRPYRGRRIEFVQAHVTYAFWSSHLRDQWTSATFATLISLTVRAFDRREMPRRTFIGLNRITGRVVCPSLLTGSAIECNERPAEKVLLHEPQRLHRPVEHCPNVQTPSSAPSAKQATRRRGGHAYLAEHLADERQVRSSEIA